MKQLRADIKSGEYKRIYLLCGEERYLVMHYEAQIKKNVMPKESEAMNFSVFYGKETMAEMIIDSSETLPFFNDYRLVIAKDTGFFAQGRKDESDKVSKYIEDIPDTTIIVFVESNIDKRSGLYKKISKKGMVIDFKTPTEKELINWIVGYCKKQGKNISNSTAIYLLRTVANGMDAISSELDKLISYCEEDSEITPKEIALICNKSLESKIFDLVGALGNKNTSTALDIFSNMIQMKESPIMVLTMIARQFKLILLCKHLQNKKMSVDEIAQKLALRSFIVRECIKQGRNFEISSLKNIFSECIATDVKIKSGQMNDKIAVEMLILSV